MRIDRELYLDGGLRQNTPIAPALRLGATHIFAVGGSREVKGVSMSEGGSAGPDAPGMAFLLGKVLNAFLLDHIDVDVELMTRLNNVLGDGERAFGDDFAERMSAEAHRRGAPAYRHVQGLVVRPSDDIGRLASEHVRRGRFRRRSDGDEAFAHPPRFRGGSEADLASYLLFDGAFCRQLIELGRADAKARRESSSRSSVRPARTGGSMTPRSRPGKAGRRRRSASGTDRFPPFSPRRPQLVCESHGPNLRAIRGGLRPVAPLQRSFGL